MMPRKEGLRRMGFGLMNKCVTRLFFSPAQNNYKALQTTCLP